MTEPCRYPLDEIAARLPAIIYGPPPVAHPCLIQADSRRVRPGDCFCACHPDARVRSGHIAAAVAAGARAVIRPEAEAIDAVTVLVHPRPRAALARIGVWAWGLDVACPPLVAVTGTDGKTTTAWCLQHLAGLGAALVGTLGLDAGDGLRPGSNTTPGPAELHPFLAGLTPSCPVVAIEASSIGLDQDRLAGLRLRAIIHTGIGHDHLDYHHSMSAYVAAKQRILDLAEDSARVVLNADDPALTTCAELAHQRGLRLVSLGHGAGTWRLHHEADAWHLVDGRHVHRLQVPLPGSFNAWNVAAAILALAEDDDQIAALAEASARLQPPPGRLERLADGPITYVDYAHTPQAVERVIAALRQTHPGRRLACVFGCGGDRDRAKRGPMGHAALGADVAVLTSDNSRSESPAAIASDVISALPASAVVRQEAPWSPADMVVVLDRAAAIRLGRTLAGVEGVVVVCGKGHETGQEEAGVTRPWDDRRFVMALGREVPHV